MLFPGSSSILRSFTLRPGELRPPRPSGDLLSVHRIPAACHAQVKGLRGICSLASLSPLFHVPLDLGYAAQSAALPLTRKQELKHLPPR